MLRVVFWSCGDKCFSGFLAIATELLFGSHESFDNCTHCTNTLAGERLGGLEGG